MVKAENGLRRMYSAISFFCLLHILPCRSVPYEYDPTRTRKVGSNYRAAKKLLVSEKIQIILDRVQLDAVIQKTIKISENWPADKSLEFGSHLNTIIYRYR